MRKKLLAFILSALMIIGLCLPVSADEVSEIQAIESEENTKTSGEDTILQPETEDIVVETPEVIGICDEEIIEVKESAEEFDINKAGLTGYAVPLECDERSNDELSLLLSGSVPTQADAYSAMMAFKSGYPEGTPYTNDNYYPWKGGIFSGGYGCAGFAFMLSDAAFGDLPARKISPVNLSQVHVGDILRVNNDTHSVIVTEVYSNYVVLAEGNYNASVHWGRTMTASEVADSTYLLTRYPVGTFGETYTITYDANGGNNAPEAQLMEKGMSESLSTLIPDRFLFEFVGWATSSNVEMAEYHPGDSFAGDHNITLYAVWQKAEYQSILNEFPKMYTANIPREISHVVYEFVPFYSGTYVFESYGSIDTIVAVFNENGNEIGKDDDGGSSFNFKLSVELTGGKTYYISVSTYYGANDASFDFTVEKEQVQPYAFCNMNMIITDSLNMNLYAELSEEVLNDENAYCHISCDGEQRAVIKVSDAKYSEKLEMYVFSWDFVPAQMSDIVNVQIVYGDGLTGDIINVQVTDYITEILNTFDEESYVSLKRILIALLKYGDEAQRYFNYATHRPIGEALLSYNGNVTINNDLPNIDQAKEVKFDVPGIKYYGSCLVLVNNPKIVHYFTLEDGYNIDDFDFRLYGEKIYPEQKDGLFRISVYESYMTKLNKVIDLKINGIGVYYAASTYVAGVVFNEDEENRSLKDLMINFYRFYVEINNYVNGV